MTTPPLSVAAQVVLVAHTKARCQREWSTVNDPPCHPADPDWNGCHLCVDRAGIAAGIRALVEQVARKDRTDMPYITPADILDIAAELDHGEVKS